MPSDRNDRRPVNQSFPTTFLALLAVLALPAPAHPQEVTALTEDLCASCSLEITPDVLLGADGESVIGSAWDIQRLSDGRFTMAFQNIAAWAEFTIFSADGADFHRVGREGEGPGEYGQVVWVREHGEELYVFDNQRRRMTVLDSDFEAIRTAPVGCLVCNGFDMAMLPGGRVESPDTDREPLPLSGLGLRRVAAFPPPHQLPDRPLGSGNG